MIDWDWIAKELQSKTVDELESLEREDYHVYLDRLTEGMSPVQRSSAYELFGGLLRATYDGKIERLKSA